MRRITYRVHVFPNLGRESVGKLRKLLFLLDCGRAVGCSDGPEVVPKSTPSLPGTRSSSKILMCGICVIRVGTLVPETEAEEGGTEVGGRQHSKSLRP